MSSISFGLSPSLQRFSLSTHWSLYALLLIACSVLIPLIALIFVALFQDHHTDDSLWPHLLQHVVPYTLGTTFKLMIGVSLLSSLIGVSTAWFIAVYRFKGRLFLQWALLLPLAFPTYLAAYAYTDFFEFTGPLQSGLRLLFGWQNGQDYWFFEIRSLGGAIWVLSLVLYPYIYLSCRAFFAMQSASILDSARLLGASPFTLFLRIALPLVRPALILGLSLVLMESLNDIGAVEFFGVRTLTFAIYETWLNRGSLSGAAQLSGLMLMVIFILIVIEQMSRHSLVFHTRQKNKSIQPLETTPLRGFLMMLWCALPVFLGFLIPFFMVLHGARRQLSFDALSALSEPLFNSVFLSLCAAFIIMIFGLLSAYHYKIKARDLKTKTARFLTIIITRLVAFGYGIPGTVMALGLLIGFLFIERQLAHTLGYLGIESSHLFITGGLFILIMAYSIRFLTICEGALSNGFDTLSPHLGHAAKILGASDFYIFFKIYIPLLKPALLTSFLLIFVECMKELPATLLLRPFNFETLSTSIYADASRNAFDESTLGALFIVALSLLPILFLARSFHNENAHPHRSSS